jgi:hypothetical protein
MAYDIAFLGADRRSKDGKLWDVVDYQFEVSGGSRKAIVAVGITGQFHDPAEALGSKKLSKEERVEAASAWLRSRLDKKDCDPFNRPASDSTIDLPSTVMDHWIEHRSIPGWV